MEDALTLAERLRDAPDLFPWVCLAIICIVAVAQHKRIFAYFDARIEAYSASKQFKAIMIELMRNNTAALESCTEEREKSAASAHSPREAERRARQAYPNRRQPHRRQRIEKRSFARAHRRQNLQAMNRGD